MSKCKGQGPRSFRKFHKAPSDYQDLVRVYLARGYDFCLTAITSSEDGITCGDLDYEYRNLAQPAIFFKGEPPAWDFLAKGGYRGTAPVVIVEYRKFFSRMSSVGRGLFAGEFSGKELAQWIKFWERREAERVPLKDHLQESSAA